MTLVLTMTVTAALLAATAPSSYPGKPADPSAIPVTLRFEDQPVARVLEGLFAAGGVRGRIDPCVTGRVSIALENVTLGAALDAVARLADLEVKSGQGPAAFVVTCRDAEARSRALVRQRTGDAVRLRFRIESIDPDGRRDVRSEPALIVPLGETAEIAESSDVPDYALTADGEVLTTNTRPSVRLVLAVVAERGGFAREARGLFEIATKEPRDPEGPVMTATLPFRAPLTAAGEVPLGALDLNGTRWILTLVDAE